MSLEATLLSLIENQNIQVQGELSISQNIYAAPIPLITWKNIFKSFALVLKNWQIFEIM